MKFINYPKCSTCVKAKKHLIALDKTFEDIDIVLNTPSKEELLNWIQLYGQGIKPFFNTSGKVYKELQLKDQVKEMNEDDAATLLASNGMLIKRPLLIDNDRIIIGYKVEDYNKL